MKMCIIITNIYLSTLMNVNTSRTEESCLNAVYERIFFLGYCLTTYLYTEQIFDRYTYSIQIYLTGIRIFPSTFQISD